MALDPLSTATAGLRQTQAAIGLISQNVANAGTPGYVRRTLNPVSGYGNAGVARGTVTRSFEPAALKQLRLETAGAGYTATRADVATQVDNLFGNPGSGSALDGLINTFTQALQGLSTSPTSSAARSTVLDAATNLAGRIGTIASGVQNLRSGLESQLGTETADASALLAGVAQLNVKIQGTVDEAARADLLDQRDQKLNQLSAYLDIQTVDQRDGTVTVLTNSGVTLVDRGSAATLSFDGRAPLNANSAYNIDPSRRSVGTVTATTPGGGRVDLGEAGAIRSGSIGAALELRDTTLPQVQRQLDDLAAGLASALTDKSVTGTVSGTGATTELAGIQPGNTLTLALKAPDGSTRTVILVASNKATAGIDPRQTDDSGALAQTFDISGGPATYASAIQTALTALSGRASAAGYPAVPALTATGSGSAVTVTGTGGWSVTGAGATVTVPTSASDTGTAYPRIALFVDGGTGGLFTGSFDNGSQLTGLAQRLSVNPAVKAKPALLTATGATGTGADGTRAQFITDALTSAQHTFSAASGISGLDGPTRSSVTEFARNVVASQGAAAANAQSLDDGQSVALSTAQSRFSQVAGVSIDEEMSNLIALQNAYGANARVLTAARDMLDTLLRI